MFLFCFFFQAEDGIRDVAVTGVQTCALPIYRHKETGQLFKERKDWENKGFKEEEMAQDVKVIMPPLDLFSKTK